MLKDYLSSFAPQLHGHVELRAQISTSHAVAMLNGDLQSNARAQQGRRGERAFPGCPREEEPSRAAGAAQRHGGEG